MADIEWSAIRGSVVLFVLALLASAALSGGAMWFHDDRVSGYERYRRALAAARSRYRTVDTERRLIETYLPTFRALQAAGIIGGERRLEWIESLREIAARVQLPSLQYRIERQTSDATDPVPEAAMYRSFSTVMHIEAGLLHEGDLGELIRWLETEEIGLHHLERCDITRLGSNFVMQPDAINLSAVCDLRWLTFQRVEVRP